MSLAVPNILAFAFANAGFFILLRLAGYLPTVLSRSLARELLFWGVAGLQFVTASRGVHLLPNNLPWLGLIDDAGCVLGGVWLGFAALRERTLRAALRRSIAAPHGGGRC